MRRWLILILISIWLVIPVNAVEYTAPEVPDDAQEFLPEDTQSFSEGLWYIVKQALVKFQPSVAEASGVCLSLICVVILGAFLRNFSDSASHVIRLVTTLMMALFMLKPSNALISLGAKTIQSISEYGKLLLPVMTGALAAQGGTSSSAALYTATALIDSVLMSAIGKVMIPMLYIYLCLCIANCVTSQSFIKNLKDFHKWSMTWFLKIVLYIFTGYIAVTGVVSGTVDAAAIKATKLAISGAVPVVGGIISDASEAILVSAGLVKSAVGVYGLLAIIAILIGPMVQIGSQYLLLKATSGVCAAIDSKEASSLISDFSGAMGMVMAMSCTVGLLFLISTVCFMKGVS